MTKPNFYLISASHNVWCMQLNSFVSSNAAKPPASSDRECQLGKWIYDNAFPEYGAIQELQDLKRLHQELHAIAQKIIQLKNNGRIREAQQQLVNLQEYSDRIAALLKELDLKIN